MSKTTDNGDVSPFPADQQEADLAATYLHALKEAGDNLAAVACAGLSPERREAFLTWNESAAETLLEEQGYVFLPPIDRSRAGQSGAGPKPSEPAGDQEPECKG